MNQVYQLSHYNLPYRSENDGLSGNNTHHLSNCFLYINLLTKYIQCFKLYATVKNLIVDYKLTKGVIKDKAMKQLAG
jgi:hypothetical protein